MCVDLHSLTWPESDWLDSGAEWGCTPVVHSASNVHRLNQPSTHALRSPAWQHVTQDYGCLSANPTINRFSNPICVVCLEEPSSSHLTVPTAIYCFTFLQIYKCTYYKSLWIKASAKCKGKCVATTQVECSTGLSTTFNLFIFYFFVNMYYVSLGRKIS